LFARREKRGADNDRSDIGKLQGKRLIEAERGGGGGSGVARRDFGKQIKKMEMK